MPRNFSRPNLPYINVSLPNDKRFQLLTRSNRRPPTDQIFDSEFDYVIDALNILDVAMDGISLGDLPGVGVPNNANKLLTTDGAGTSSWVFVQSSNILDESITGRKIFPQTITALQLADGGIGATQLAPNSVTTIKILDANITFAKMAPDSVGTINLVDANVTFAKMAPDSVGTPNLVDDCVTTPKILNANVTTPKIADANITTIKILDANVTTPKIADGAITLPKIANNIIKVAASKAEQIAGTSNNVYTSPLVQQNHPSAAKAWGKITGTTLVSSYNVTSVNNTGAGLFTVTFANSFPSSDYVIDMSVNLSNNTNCPLFGYYDQTTNSFKVSITNANGNNTTPTSWSFAIHGLI